MDASTATDQYSKSLETHGNLRVLGGRRRGTRRPLRSSLTFLGKSSTCDIRLRGDNVSPVHCLIAHNNGLVELRDLETEIGTMVNGRRVSSCVLHDGDQLEIGVFRFQVELPKQDGDAENNNKKNSGKADDQSKANEAAKQAERVQVAAVAAQQAALTELEMRLAQRQSTLEIQQAQLAGHLEDKRKRILSLHTETQEARKSLEQQQQTYERHVEEVSHDLSQAQLELIAEKQQVLKHRQRLVKLRKRLRQRFRHDWADKEQTIAENETILADAFRFLNQQKDRIQKEKEGLTHTCLKYNTDIELGRRQLKSEWDKLMRERETFRRESQAWKIELLNRSEEYLDAEAIFCAEKEKFEANLECLRAETEGLENRARNQRGILHHQNNDIERLQIILTELRGKLPYSDPAPQAEPKIYPLATPLSEEQRIEHWLYDNPPALLAPQVSDEEIRLKQCFDELQSAAGDIVDQRACLVEQWEMLLKVKAHWENERREICAEIAVAIDRLKQQAQTLLEREQELQVGLDKMQQRSDELLQWRQHLTGWQGRLQAQELSWEADRDRTLAKLRGREESAKKHQKELDEIDSRWKEEHEEALKALRAEREEYAKTRQEFLVLSQERRKQIEQLQDERRQQAAQALAVEQYRQQCMKRSKNVEAAKKRLDRMHHRLVKDKSKRWQTTVKENQALQTELLRLQALHQQLEQKYKKMENDYENLVINRSEWEKQRVATKKEQAKLQHQLKSTQAQRDRSQQQVVSLREEMERIARMLLEEPLPPPILLHRSRNEKAAEPLDRAA